MLFTNLNKADQERAIEETQNDEYYPIEDWYESVTEDFKTILELLGYYSIETSFSGFWSQGDGASFTAGYSTDKRIAPKIKAYAPKDKELYRIAQAIQVINRKCGYDFNSSIYHSGSNYNHSNTMLVESDYDYNQVQYEDEFLVLSRDLADWYYVALEECYDYQMSDDVVREHLIANEVEFNYHENH